MEDSDMPEYLTVSDFLTYDAQMTRRIARVEDKVEAVREQVNNLTIAFTSYVAETDKFRNETNRQLSELRSDLNGLKQAVNSRFDTLEQTMEHGFSLIFARLGITPT
jgi:DNA repair exonuclease SbcCD ATPase subunit